jgi:hypothetical protein
MCVSQSTHNKINPYNDEAKPNSSLGLGAKGMKTLDPLGYQLNQGLDETRFPAMPNVKTPDPLQEGKTPDRDLNRNRKAFNELNSGTLLTGPSGISKNALTVGKTTLLGG